MTTTPDDPASPDVIVVGAGLAGLAAAATAHAAGRRVLVLEADDTIGGRVRTDDVDGFRLDRGFQVLLTAYPTAAAVLDLDALQLGSFEPGAATWNGRRMRVVADPLRRPLMLPATLAAGVATPRDALELVSLLRRVRRPRDAYQLLAGSADAPEVTTADALERRHGFSARLRRAFLEPFFRGVLLDPQLRASSRMFEFTLRMFAEGSAALPAGGMDRIPRQLAARLPDGAIRLRSPVDRLDESGVVLADGSRIDAPAVVVAAGPWEARRLLGDECGEDPATAVGTATAYFDAPCSPLRNRMLVLNGVGPEDGPVNEVSVPSDVAPGYAPDGRALVGASMVGIPALDDGAIEQAVRDQLRRWFGGQVDEWRLLRVVRVERALPDQSPPWLVRRDWPVEVAPGRWVAGDHRDTASIDGALRSGARAGSAAAGFAADD